MSEVVSFRLPKGTVTQLKMLACRLSLERKKEIRWTALVKQAIDTLLQEEPTEQRFGRRVIRHGSEDPDSPHEESRPLPPCVRLAL
jgi:hypothetical protein